MAWDLLRTFESQIGWLSCGLVVVNLMPSPFQRTLDWRTGLPHGPYHCNLGEREASCICCLLEPHSYSLYPCCGCGRFVCWYGRLAAIAVIRRETPYHWWMAELVCLMAIICVWWPIRGLLTSNVQGARLGIVQSNSPHSQGWMSKSGVAELHFEGIISVG